MRLDRLKHFAFERDGFLLAAYDSGGKGLPVVFQHGLCGDAGQVAEAFPDDPGLRLVTLECRGHGRSPAGEAFSIARFAGDVAALIEHLGLQPAILGGISMGAAIAVRLAVRRPDLVRALVLARPAWVADAAPPNMQPNAEVAGLLAAMPPAEARAVFVAGATHRRLAAEAPDNLQSLLGFFTRVPQGQTAALVSAIAADGPGIAEADLLRIGVPALVLATEQDAIHPVAHAERLAALIPDATLRMLPPKGVGKPLYLADFHAALNDFLRDFR